QLGPLVAAGSARHRVLLDTLEAYLAAGGRKAQAARALHLERQSLYLRLHRIEELLDVSLDDEDTVLGLHLAIRALAFRRRRAAA
ncbi:MAG TPA: helix-turn-helix domain-containing protein, partial [Solirubrobacteraceae bacterium]|nr:helix-turn-helix domain-containing protein [Solirubrobacteraceae bacterium]